MHKVVTLMDVQDKEYNMLLQNLQIVCYTQDNVLGFEKRPDLPLFPMRTPNTITPSGYLTVLTMNLVLYIDDPRGFLTILDPSLSDHSTLV